MVLQGCSKGDSRVFQGCLKGVSRVSQGCLKGVSRVFQGCSKGVPRVFFFTFNVGSVLVSLVWYDFILVYFYLSRFKLDFDAKK